MNRRWPAASLLMTAGFAALFALAWRFLGFTGFNNDHYVHLSRAYQMWLGEWPVRDFVDPGMPLMYAVSAAARALFGPALFVEWMVVAGALAIGAACTVVAAQRLSGSLAVAVLATLIEVTINPRSFGYPKIVLYAAAAVLFLGVASRPTGWRVAALGLMTSIAFLFRHDHGLFIGIGSAVTLLLAGEQVSWRAGMRRVALLALWVALFLAPWALFVERHMGIVNYFASAIAFSRGEAALSSLRGLPRFDWSGADMTANGLTWLFYLFHALPFTCVALVIRRRRLGDAWSPVLACVVGLSAVGVLVNAAFMRDSLEGRLPDAVVPAVLLGAWLLGPVLRTPWRQPARTALATAVVVMTGGAVFEAAHVDEQVRRAQLPSGPRAVQGRAADLWERLGKRLPEGDQVPSRYSRSLLPFLEYVHRCTAPDDRLIMTGLFPEVYVLAERGFAGGHMAFMPGIYTADDDQARTVARLDRQSVPFVLVVKQYEGDLRTAMPALAAYLDARYAPMAHIPVSETKGVDVHIERGRPVTNVDPATSWPCFAGGEHG